MSTPSRTKRRRFGAAVFAAGWLLLLALISPLPTPQIAAAPADDTFLPLIGSAPLVCDGVTPGLIGYTHTKFGNPVRLDVQSDRAYVVDWSGSLMIFDVSDPCRPNRLGYAIWQENEFQDIAVLGNVAYIANDANGLAKYDVSNPAAPVRLVARKDGPGYSNSVAIDVGQFALVSQHYAPSTTLAIYDLATFPFRTPTFYWPGPDWDHLWEVEVAGNRAYISVRDAGANVRFQILDISALPAVPTVVATLDFPKADYGDGFAIEVAGDTAYLASSDDVLHDGGLVIVNMADETAPFVAGSYFFPTAGAMPWKQPGLEVVGHRAYLVGSDGLYVFDVADPQHIALLFTLPFPAAFGRTVGGDVVIRGDLAFVAVRSPDDPGANDVGGLAIYHLPVASISGAQTQPPPHEN